MGSSPVPQRTRQNLCRQNMSTELMEHPQVKHIWFHMDYHGSNAKKIPDFVLEAGNIKTIVCNVTSVRIELTLTVKFVAITPKDCFPFDFTTARTQIDLDLKDMFIQPTFGDETINVGEKTLYANRDILAARSSVFAAMFNIDMLESITNTIRYNRLQL